jgi:hypothetical protein
MSQSYSQAVGFQFQGDVFAGSALGFSALGRIMKQMSDTSIDVYAVHALVQLGGIISISQHQESVVATAIRKRSQTRKGWLSQALCPLAGAIATLSMRYPRPGVVVPHSSL